MTLGPRFPLAVQIGILAGLCVGNLFLFFAVRQNRVDPFLEGLGTPYSTYIVLLAYTLMGVVLGPLLSLYLGGRIKSKFPDRGGRSTWGITASVFFFSMMPAFVPLFLLVGGLKR